MSKILFIDVNYNQGSTGKIVHDLKNWFDKNGHQTLAIFGRGKQKTNHSVIRVSKKITTYFHAFFTRIFGFVGQGNFISTFKTIRIIKKFKPDYINIHQLHGYYIHIYLLLRFLKKYKYKTFITCHDYFYITGKCGYNSTCFKWKSICERCPQKKSYPKSLFFDRTKSEFLEKKVIYENFDNLVFLPVSEWLAKSYRLSPLLSSKKILPIHNGLDTNIFKRYPNSNIFEKKHDIKNRKIVLYVTSNFNGEMKGGKYFIEIANKLLNENILFVIVGNLSNSDIFPKNVSQID
jgi:glycosyltransferase involved in cell wall biosynthesis